MAGFKWTQPPDKVWPAGAEAYARAVRAGVHGVCQKNAPLIANWMKQNKVWQDRTSAAVQSLHSEVEPATAAEVVGIIELIMAHGVEHGYWLEGMDPRHGFARTRLGDRFAIIQPALDYWGPKVWAEIRSLFT